MSVEQITILAAAIIGMLLLLIVAFVYLRNHEVHTSGLILLIMGAVLAGGGGWSSISLAFGGLTVALDRAQDALEESDEVIADLVNESAELQGALETARANISDSRFGMTSFPPPNGPIADLGNSNAWQFEPIGPMATDIVPGVTLDPTLLDRASEVRALIDEVRSPL